MAEYKWVWLESPRCLPCMSATSWGWLNAGLRWDWDWSAYTLNDHFRVVGLRSWRVMKYPSRRIFKDNQAEAARLLIQSRAPRTPLPPHSLVKRSRPPQVQREGTLWPLTKATPSSKGGKSVAIFLLSQWTSISLFFPSGTGNMIHSIEKNQLIPTDP